MYKEEAGWGQQQEKQIVNLMAREHHKFQEKTIRVM